MCFDDILNPQCNNNNLQAVIDAGFGKEKLLRKKNVEKSQKSQQFFIPKITSMPMLSTSTEIGCNNTTSYHPPPPPPLGGTLYLHV